MLVEAQLVPISGYIPCGDFAPRSSGKQTVIDIIRSTSVVAKLSSLNCAKTDGMRRFVLLRNVLRGPRRKSEEDLSIDSWCVAYSPERAPISVRDDLVRRIKERFGYLHQQPNSVPSKEGISVQKKARVRVDCRAALPIAQEAAHEPLKVEEPNCPGTPMKNVKDELLRLLAAKRRKLSHDGNCNDYPRAIY